MKTTTFREQGMQLPVGKVVNGQVLKDFSLRRPTAKVDRLLNIWREANQNRHIAHEVCKYLSLVVESAMGDAYPLAENGDSTPEQMVKFLHWCYGDVMYAYMYARVAMVSEWVEIGYACPTCGHEGTLEADLWDHTVDVLETPDEFICDVEFRDGFKAGDSVAARVRGDGREYRLNLYVPRDSGRYSFRQTFKTKKGEWIEVSFPVDTFDATWRGRVFPDHKLDPSKVNSVGFLLADKKAGPLKLEVEWIKVTKEE